MKRSKKIVSLLLALAFAFSLMATTAMAAEPMGVVLPGICPHCGEPAAITRITEPQNYFEPMTCPKNGNNHLHVVKRWKEYYDCDICGYVVKEYAKDLGCLTVEIQ